jgi:hypothetical protein
MAIQMKKFSNDWIFPMQNYSAITRKLKPVKNEPFTFAPYIYTGS